jgi:hypothetical protein
MSELPERHVREGMATVECWFYVRVFSGVSGANTTTDRQSPALTHGDLKFGITIDMRNREARYKGDGGIMAFSMQLRNRLLASGIETLLKEEFGQRRSAALRYRPEYLDMQLVADALGATFQADGEGAHHRLTIARAFMERAYSVLKANRPDGYQDSSPVTLVQVDFDDPSCVVGIQGARTKTQRTTYPACVMDTAYQTEVTPESVVGDILERGSARDFVATKDIIDRFAQMGVDLSSEKVGLVITRCSNGVRKKVKRDGRQVRGYVGVRLLLRMESEACIDDRANGRDLAEPEPAHVELATPE